MMMKSVLVVLIPSIVAGSALGAGIGLMFPVRSPPVRAVAPTPAPAPAPTPTQRAYAAARERCHTMVDRARAGHPVVVTDLLSTCRSAGYVKTAAH